MTARPTHSSSWIGVLSCEQRTAAVDVAREVAVRATDPARVAAALAAVGRQTRFPESLHWEPYGVAQGDAGLAIMCAYLDACLPDEGWDAVAHELLTAAARGVARRGSVPTGLFGGLAGVIFAAASLSRNGTRYQALLDGLDGALAREASALAALEAGDPGADIHFDLISGATGIGASLLDRDPREALPLVLLRLVSLAEARDAAPRWMTPPDLLGDPEMARRYPQGVLNCGLAHGVPGPLALLALALERGIEVSGQAEAMRRMAGWLLAHRIDDAWGPNWPMYVPLAVSGTPEPRLSASRCGWCYGSPGVARALWLAGRALGDTELRETAIEAMRAVLRRPPRQRGLESPTFCHGVAGLLQIMLRFAHDTNSSVFAAAAATLADELLAAFNPERVLGYATIERGSNAVDRAGLLDGAPGVALALLAAATDVEPAWDRLFLLA